MLKEDFRMKKLALLLLCLTIVFSLSACGEDKDSEPNAPDHNYISTVVAPTCNSVGYTEHVCQDCGKSYKDNEVSATGNHNFYDLYVMESTCVSRKVIRTCSVCNTVAVIDEEPIAEHTFVNRVCTVCGELGLSEGLEFTLNSDENSYSVSRIGTCTNTNIAIPSVYNNLPVTSIGNHAFYNCDRLTGITIPSSVTSIGYKAFSDCDSLTSVIFEENSKLTSIGNWEFSECDSLTAITIPNSVSTIGDSAFYNCDSLTSVIFEENSQLTTIGNSAFSNCDSLTDIAIPSSVTSIGYEAFKDCNSLTGITVPSSVTSIGYRSFSICDSLTNITVDVNNKYYKGIDGNLYTKDGKTLIQYAMGKKDASFIIPDGVTSIGNSAFYSCDSLTNITIPSSVTSIGDYAFEDCYRLTSITIPSSVTTIGNHAFEDCYSLTTITIPSSVTSIGYEAFRYCNSLYVVYNYSNLSFEIGSSANGYVARYANILVNNGVTSYANYGYEYTLTEDGFLFEYNRYNNSGYKLIAYCGTEETITLPNDINGNKYSIDCMCGVTNIVIPNSFTTIGAGAFSACYSLTSVIFEENSKLTTIDWYAFDGCDSLNTVYYTGTESEWNTISIGPYNSDLTNATRYYYSETAPTTEGNYWHYVDGEIVVW